MVKSATEGTAKGYGGAAAEGSAAAAKTKDQPKALPDKASKQQAVKSTTEYDGGQAVRAGQRRRLGEGRGRHVAAQGKAEAEAEQPGDEGSVEALTY